MEPLATRLLFDDAAPSAIGRVRRAGTLGRSGGIRGRRLEAHALVLLVAGAGRYEDELGHDEPVAPGDLLLLDPEVRHGYGPPAGGSWSELYAVFDGPVFDLWRTCGLLDPARPVRHLGRPEPWLGRLLEVVGHPRPRTADEREVEICRFLTVLTAMLGADRRGPSWLEQAQALLRAEPAEPLDLRATAQRLQMGYEPFRKRFRREAGTSPAAYRAAHRLAIADELLASTAMTHREIAASLGFVDEFHFSRRYRQVRGLSPRDARRALRPG